MILPENHPKFLDQNWNRIELIPDSGIQFLDYSVQAVSLYEKRNNFYDHKHEDVSAELKTKTITIHPVEELPLDEEEGRDEKLYRSLIDEGQSGLDEDIDGVYRINGQKALDIFARQWIPIPLYRTQGDMQGPSNWARLYIAPDQTSTAGRAERLHIIIALDTEILGATPNSYDAAPCEQDITDLDLTFKFMADLPTLLSFAGGDWQRPWISDAYDRGLERIGKKRRNDDLAVAGEAWATYAVFVSAIEEVLNCPILSFVNVKEIEQRDKDRSNRHSQAHYLDVDLVFDIGNSRSCGILVEPGIAGESIGMGQAAVRFELRNLCDPEQITTEPFESRVEFQPARFGMSKYGMRSRRKGGKDAFLWPSAIRVGPEAASLAGTSDGRDGISGMSSPKRYVWDDKIRPESWVYTRGDTVAGVKRPPIRSAITSLLKANGRPITRDGVAGDEERYSRGSMYMLLLSELLCHAVSQVNSVSHRYRRANSGLPRRLRNLFITLPSATPIAEQHRMREHAKRAINLVWTAMNWKDDWLHPKPKLHLNWDEATCSQLVFLYNELEHRYQAFPSEFWKTMRRTDRGEEDSVLRIATLDIGGGTTDLVVIDHKLQDTIITPKQLFREGFRTAGDDIVKSVIEKIVLPSIGRTMLGAGTPDVSGLISHLFGGDTENMIRSDQVRRTVFTNAVLVPAAIRLMQEYKGTDARIKASAVAFKLSELDNLHLVADGVLDYVDDAVRKAIKQEFNVLDATVEMHQSEISGCINSVMTRTLEDSCDAIRAYQCDVLLISGRPSTLPGVMDLILSLAPVPPERMFALHEYDVGSWYPFRSRDFRIQDPKTTVAVGAYLSHQCRGRHASFVFQSDKLKIESTARYIGTMNPQGLIEKIVFENTSSTDATEVEFTLSMGARVDLGYRQLPIARWETSQLYRIGYKTSEYAIQTAKPVTLTMRRCDLGGDTDDELEFEKEQFEIISAIDADGDDVESRIELTLQTVRTIDQLEAGYWLDTGVFLTQDMVIPNTPVTQGEVL